FVPEPEPEVAPPPVNEAREKAAKSGLVALADELADLRDTSSIDSALSNRSLSNTVGAAVQNERSLVTSASGRASGGINTAELSRNTGGGGLAGRNVTQVTSPVATAAAERAASRGGSGDPALDPGAPGQRSRDQIEQIFDRNKAAIYALYRRALRQDPSLQGKLVLELTISPGGDVLDCRVVSSELDSPEFEAKLVQRVRLFKFGAQDVGTITTTKPIDFFPV
ncbi:MAG: AgmX/PglI C-terminal domain-containing protein, partial [Pseudomonadota bacterium]